MNLFGEKFEAIEMDALISQFMAKTLDPASRREFLQVLQTNHRFREAFCDWIRSSRSIAMWHVD